MEAGCFCEHSQGWAGFFVLRAKKEAATNRAMFI
jgi:hypothetical protein